MNLDDLQKAFVRSAATGKHDPQLLALVCDDARMSAQDKLAVYCNNARFALVAALEQVYPACLRTLGKDYFRQVARAYIKRHPSDDTDLNDYGAHLPEFFAELRNTRTELNDYAYLADLARLEYAYHAVYYAADTDAPFDFQAFEQCDDKEAVRFELPASMALLQTDHPVLAIWEALREKDPEDQDETLVVAGGGESLCVRRTGGLPHAERIPKDRHALLSAIAAGRTLTELAAEFKQLDAELPALIADGWISSFHPAARKNAPPSR